MYIEEIIRIDGISKILGLTRFPDSSIISECLQCLSYVLVFLNGVEYLRQRPQLFIKLFELVNHASVDVKKQVLGIFIGLCKCMNGSFICINKAAINVARRDKISPYATLLNALGIQDNELRVNILTLLNWMIVKCPSEKKLCRFLARME